MWILVAVGGVLLAGLGFYLHQGAIEPLGVAIAVAGLAMFIVEHSAVWRRRK